MWHTKIMCPLRVTVALNITAVWLTINALILNSADANEAFSSSYYVKPAEQKFGVPRLEDELYGLEWLDPCQEGMFDCGEMTAYLG